MCDRLWRRVHAHEHSGTSTCGRLDLERCANQSRALMHADQPESLAGAFGRPRIESHAIVLDD
jgi:hypothetical protein